MDHVRLGSILRRLRVRAGLRQSDVARRAGLSQPLVSSIECGHVGGVPAMTLERIFAAVGASLESDVRWRGPALDRLLDERHAAIVDASVAHLARQPWDAGVEVTYSVFGERGSIDVLGGHAEHRAMVVEEIKADIVRMDDTIRKVDEKVRLVRRGVGRDHFGWQPEEVGRILVLPDSDRARRQVRAHAATLAAAFPSRGHEVRVWLRTPVGPMAGILFVANISRASATGSRVGIQRVRVGPRADRSRAGVANLSPTDERDENR